MRQFLELVEALRDDSRVRDRLPPARVDHRRMPLRNSRVEIGSCPTPTDGVDRLWALSIDPRQFAAEYRVRIVSPYRGVRPDAAVAADERTV
jgi:hypothetical protein